MHATEILAVDQGTTSSRAIRFAQNGTVSAVAQREYRQFYPADGWVEQDADTIWTDTLAVCREVAHDPSTIAAIGITNQRETIVLWHRETGAPLHHAIVWQDRRGQALCDRLKAAGLEPTVQEKTGLLLDPYFSASKLAWLLDNVPGARALAEAGSLAAGTIDSFLLWRFTKGRLHATDATNASRTLLFNITTQEWDEDLLELFRIPRSLLPDVRDSVADYGVADAEWFGREIPIRALVGDQQSAAIGQACLAPGMRKSTYGTGCFLLRHTGSQPVLSQNRLISTVGYRVAGEVSYAQEGSIFIAGAAIKWLRDRLQLFPAAADTAALAASVPDSGGVFVVPAFTGLGAPHWDAGVRGAILGLTLDSSPAHIVRATLESIAFQTRDLLGAFAADSPDAADMPLRVDGGMVANDWFCQCLADTLGIVIERPRVIETTALGAAYLAGLGAGLFSGLDAIAQSWECERRFSPETTENQRAERYDQWQQALACIRSVP